jgi:hypothetical protein
MHGGVGVVFMTLTLHSGDLLQANPERENCGALAIADIVLRVISERIRSAMMRASYERAKALWCCVRQP